MDLFDFTTEPTPGGRRVVAHDNYANTADDEVAYLGENGTLSTTSTPYLSFTILSTSDPGDVADQIMQDPNTTGKEFLISTMDSSRLDEPATLSEVKDRDDFVKMSHGRTQNKPRYQIFYGITGHGTPVNEKGTSYLTITGPDLEDVEQDLAQYVEELHENPSITKTADELVEDTLDEKDRLGI